MGALTWLMTVDFTLMILVFCWGSMGRKVKSSIIGLLKTILQPLGKLLVQPEISNSLDTTLGMSFLGLNASSDTALYLLAKTEPGIQIFSLSELFSASLLLDDDLFSFFPICFCPPFYCLLTQT